MFKLVRDIFKVIQLINSRRAVGLQLLILSNTAAETAIIAVIPLYLSLLTDPTLAVGSAKEKFFASLNLSHNGVIDLGHFGLVILAVIVVSNVFLVLSNKALLDFCARLGAEFSDSMFKYYLSRDYRYFLKNNSSDIINDILNESLRLHGNIVFPLFTFVSRALFLCVILSGLFFVNPKVTFAIIFIVSIYYVAYYNITRKKVLRNSELVTDLSALRFKYLLEAFGLIKELKVYRKYQHFVDSQKSAHLKINYANVQNEVIAAVSKYFFETLLFGVVCFIIYYISQSGTDIRTVLPALALYFLAAYKMLPAAQQVFSSFSHLRSNIHILDRIGDKILIGSKVDMTEGGSSLSTQFKPKNWIEFQNVSFSYDGKSNQVNNLNMKIPVGKRVAFVGASGAGKTTVANMLLGLIQPHQGQILVDDQRIDEKNLNPWIQSVSFIPQAINLMDESIQTNMSFFEELSEEKIIRAAKQANIFNFIETLPNKFQTLVGDNGVKLSGGQKQRIGLARALYFDRPIIILDEATSALDNANEYEVMKNIESIQNKTIIVIAHRLSTIRKCDVIYFFEDGRMVDSGTFTDLQNKNKSFADLVLKDGAILN